MKATKIKVYSEGKRLKQGRDFLVAKNDRVIFKTKKQDIRIEYYYTHRKINLSVFVP